MTPCLLRYAGLALILMFGFVVAATLPKAYSNQHPDGHR